jgi:ATP-dependent exoDNAse (exonuclease V) alpha subunit
MAYAHYRLEAKIVGRQAKDKSRQPIPGKTVSVVAKAAYRSGQSLEDEKRDKTYNYRSRTQEVAYSEIMAPANAPAWLKEPVPDKAAGTKKQHDVRQKLWNEIERVEKRKDSTLAREFVLSLPRQLDREQQIELVRGWCQSEFVDKGFVVDLAVHKSKGGKNPHAHVLVTTRPVTPDGFGKKPDTAGKFNGRGVAGYGAKSDLMQWRESWCNAENKALEKAGRPERADHRSLKARGIDKIPEPKIGVEATAMKRKGKLLDPENFKRLRQVKLLNEVMPHLRDMLHRGSVRQHGNGKAWWQRSADLARQARQKVRGVWQKFLDRQPKKEHQKGVERER